MWCCCFILSGSILAEALKKSAIVLYIYFLKSYFVLYLVCSEETLLLHIGAHKTCRLASLSHCCCPCEFRLRSH